MKWLVPENELDREQREFLKNLVVRTSNEQILGFPGSGKTILLLYAVKTLKKHNHDAEIIFVEFTHALIKMIEAALAELQYTKIKVVTYIDFMRNPDYDKNFDYILCDEVQDIPERVISRMKRRGKRVLIAGDRSQSIYDEDPCWREAPCSQEGIDNLISPSQISLSIIHRLSKFIINAVDNFLPNMKITSGRFSMVKSHPKIRLWKGTSELQEVEAIYNDAMDYVNEGYSIGILLPSHKKIKRFANLFLQVSDNPEWEEVKNRYNKPDYNYLNKHFEECELPIQYVANGYGNFSQNEQKITLITYHSSKGLDFDRVYLPFCTETRWQTVDLDGLFDDDGEQTDESIKGNTIDKDAVLFMVAMTRSRGDLVITFNGPLNRYVETFKQDCTYRDLDKDNTPDIPGLWPNDKPDGTSSNGGDIFGW